ncbi:hypothetical protein ACHAWF_016226 [Thalassiosira exigua]
MSSPASEDLLPSYALSAQLIADGEPVRCVAANDAPGGGGGAGAGSTELLSGSQGGVVSRIVVASPDAKPGADGGANGDDGRLATDPALEIQPGGDGTRHPHQIAALLSSSAFPAVPAAYATGCKDGNVRIFDGSNHALKSTLGGHGNAATSLSWIPGAAADDAPWLVSGSWDGTAKVWTSGGVGGASWGCACTLGGHENTVSVAGLPPLSSGVRRVATVSAGVAEGNAIRGHTVRIWHLTSSSDGSMIASEMKESVANDHSGPMRDVVYDAETDAIYTCSNDGTVKVRSSIDGSCTATLACPGDRPMLLSLCVVGSGGSQSVVAGAEDGTVIVWDVSSNGGGREPQVISHPGCVWRVSPMPLSSSPDFVTACNDGHLRIFTRHAPRVAPDSVLASFSQAVAEATASRSSGPTPDEIAKLPKWEMNALTRGRSEGQVQVFNKGGKAIAAQWSEASGTWIEVGEVTGQNPNAGTIDGKRYDHVLPIEIDVPGGGVQKLQIGYNNGDNPFVTAQAFIDEHMLDQNYLAQIADYIRQRAGESGPTLGAGGGGGSGGDAGGASSYSAPAPAPTPMEVTPTYDHLPMKGYKAFDAGIDKKGLGKVLAKIRELNGDAPESRKLTSREAGEVLDSLAATLAVTNRYHSSSVSDMELAVIHKMATTWDAKRIFPALDLARMAALHPDAANAGRRGVWEGVLAGALDACAGLGDGIAGEVAVPMLTMRLCANCFRGGGGAAAAAGGMVERILECAEACAPSKNKNVRLSVATTVLNAASFMHSSAPPPSPSSAVKVLDAVGTIVGCGTYEPEPMVRSLVAMGTTLLLPGSCGEMMLTAARERGMGSMAERAASGNGAKAAAVATEISSILSS